MVPNVVVDKNCEGKAAVCAGVLKFCAREEGWGLAFAFGCEAAGFGGCFLALSDLKLMLLLFLLMSSFVTRFYVNGTILSVHYAYLVISCSSN